MEIEANVTLTLSSKEAIYMKSLFLSAIASSAVTFTQFAIAEQNEVRYYQNNPDGGQLIIELSGACSGKIKKPITRVTYGRVIDFTGNSIDRDGANAGIAFITGDSEISAVGFNSGYLSGEQFTESVKDNTRYLTFTSRNDVTAYFKSLAYGSYDDKITCKDGKSLGQQVLHWGAVLNRFQKKTSLVSVKHTNSIDNPLIGQYKAKLVTSGTLGLPGQCGVNGSLFNGEYQFTCSPPKAIRVKVSATAEGSSTME